MTIKDIARRSGYAVGTVSRVLNGQPGVSAAARERILAVVEQTGFKPNTNARHLKQRGSREIGIIVKGARNLLFAAGHFVPGRQPGKFCPQLCRGELPLHAGDDPRRYARL